MFFFFLLIVSATMILTSFSLRSQIYKKSVIPLLSSLNSQKSYSNLENKNDFYKRVLVPVANGSEEIETVTIIDTLIRGGATVVVASVNQQIVTCSRGVRLVADVDIRDCLNENYDMIVLPGGMPGATNLRNCEFLISVLKRHYSEKRLIAAICASPAVVLSDLGILNNCEATCYPANKFESTIPNLIKDVNVVMSNNIITSRGPATAIEFSLKLVEVLFGSEIASRISSEMLYA